MTPRQAIAELAGLYIKYRPMLEALMEEAEEESVTKAVAEEKRLAKRIWTLGKIAFGPAAGARLHMLGPIETREIDPPARCWLEAGQALNPDHFHAVQCCIVRSNRLGEMLKDGGIERAPNIMCRAVEMWKERVDKEGSSPGRGKAASWHREIAKEIGCQPDTVKKAIQRYRKKGTVPK